jgi:hypothetical protein
VSLPAANILLVCEVKAAAPTTADFLIKSRLDRPDSFFATFVFMDYPFNRPSANIFATDSTENSEQVFHSFLSVNSVSLRLRSEPALSLPKGQASVAPLLPKIAK